MIDIIISIIFLIDIISISIIFLILYIIVFLFSPIFLSQSKVFEDQIGIKVNPIFQFVCIVNYLS